ncbi:hypothetical protein HanIR_Chr13g0639151 [Helianthus annuus]|nr:hypothetical protein HanIR_Chr13g0639151 [Helianthus annuus]
MLLELRFPDLAGAKMFKRFAKLLSGTEAFCVYLRPLGAKIGNHCSIRAINPVSDSRLISLGAGVHLGDFSRIAAGFYARTGSKVGISKSMITQWLGVKAFYFRVQLLKTT